MLRDVAVLEIEAIRLTWKGKKSAIPVMLHRWVKEDKILKLKNGLYIFSKKYRRKGLLRFVLVSYPLSLLKSEFRILKKCAYPV